MVVEQGSVMLCDAVRTWLPRSGSYDRAPCRFLLNPFMVIDK